MAARRSKTYRYKDIEFFAERGLVTVIDTELAADSDADPHDAIQRIPPGDFIFRAINVHVATGELYPEQVAASRKLLDDAVIVCKLAKAQGDPTDPRVLEHFGRHRRRSSALVLPGEANRILGPVGGDRFKLDLKKDRRAMLLKGATVTPDLSLAMSDPQVMTPQRAETIRKARAAGRQP